MLPQWGRGELRSIKDLHNSPLGNLQLGPKFETCATPRSHMYVHYLHHHITNLETTIDFSSLCCELMMRLPDVTPLLCQDSIWRLISGWMWVSVDPAQVCLKDQLKFTVRGFGSKFGSGFREIGSRPSHLEICLALDWLPIRCQPPITEGLVAKEA